MVDVIGTCPQWWIQALEIWISSVDRDSETRSSEGHGDQGWFVIRSFIGVIRKHNVLGEQSGGKIRAGSRRCEFHSVSLSMTLSVVVVPEFVWSFWTKLWICAWGNLWEAFLLPRSCNGAVIVGHVCWGGRWKYFKLCFLWRAVWVRILRTRENLDGIRSDWWATVSATSSLGVGFFLCFSGLCAHTSWVPCLFRRVANPRFRDPNLWIHISNSLCVVSCCFFFILSPSQDLMHCTLCITVGLCTLCQKSKLHQHNSFFFCVVMTLALLLVRPGLHLTDVGFLWVCHCHCVFFSWQSAFLVHMGHLASGVARKHVSRDSGVRHVDFVSQGTMFVNHLWMAISLWCCSYKVSDWSWEIVVPCSVLFRAMDVWYCENLDLMFDRIRSSTLGTTKHCVLNKMASGNKDMCPHSIEKKRWRLKKTKKLHFFYFAKKKNMRSMHSSEKSKNWWARLKATDGTQFYWMKRGRHEQAETWETHHGHIFIGSGIFDNKHGVGIMLNKKRWRKESSTQSTSTNVPSLPRSWWTVITSSWWVCTFTTLNVWITTLRRCTKQSRNTWRTLINTFQSLEETSMLSCHISTDAWRTCIEIAHASLYHSSWWHCTPHGSSSQRIHSHPRSYSWAHLFDSISLFSSISSSCLSPLFHFVVFLEQHQTIVMANLRWKRVRTPWTPSPLLQTVSGAMHATMVPDSKKMDMPFVVVATAKWVRDLVYEHFAHTETKEGALQLLLDKVARECRPEGLDWQILRQVSPSHSGEGSLHSAWTRWNIIWQFSKTKSRLFKVTPHSPILPWTIRHAAWVLTRYNLRRDTRMTPYEKTRGQEDRKEILPLGTQVLPRRAATGNRPLVGTWHTTLIIPSAWPKTSRRSGWLQKILPDNRPPCNIQNYWTEMQWVENQNVDVDSWLHEGVRFHLSQIHFGGPHILQHRPWPHQLPEEDTQRPEGICTDRRRDHFRYPSKVVRCPACSTRFFNTLWRTKFNRWQKKQGMGIHLSDHDYDCFTKLRFADDVMSFETSKEQIRKMMCEFKKATEKVRLRIHPKHLEVDDMIIEILTRKESVKYLGQNLILPTRNDRNQELDQGGMDDLPQIQARVDIKTLHAPSPSSAFRRHCFSDCLQRSGNVGTQQRTRENDCIDAMQGATTHYPDKQEIQKDWGTRYWAQRSKSRNWHHGNE